MWVPNIILLDYKLEESTKIVVKNSFNSNLFKAMVFARPLTLHIQQAGFDACRCMLTSQVDPKATTLLLQ